MMEYTCPQCQTPQRPRAKFCRACGAKLEATVVADGPAVSPSAHAPATAPLRETSLGTEPLSPAPSLTTEASAVEPPPAKAPTESVITLPWIETKVVALGRAPAGFVLRLEAAVIDLFISLIAALLALIIVVNLSKETPTLALLGVVGLGAMSLVFLANNFILSPVRGQSIGMMVVGIKLVKENGEDIGFARSLLRHTVGYLLSLVGLGLGFLWVLVDAKQQGWHDKLSRTLVVRVSQNG